MAVPSKARWHRIGRLFPPIRRIQDLEAKKGVLDQIRKNEARTMRGRGDSDTSNRTQEMRKRLTIKLALRSIGIGQERIKEMMDAIEKISIEAGERGIVDIQPISVLLGKRMARKFIQEFYAYNYLIRINSAPKSPKKESGGSWFDRFFGI